jgi:hypothetical protein
MDVYNVRIIGAILLMVFVATTPSCHSQTNNKNVMTIELPQSADAQIDEYVVEVFEDSKGNLWFGTILY